jgi:hypothetical protein
MRQATQPAAMAPGGQHGRTRGAPEQEVQRVGCAQPCHRGQEVDRQRHLARQGDHVPGPGVEHHQHQGAMR